METHPLNRFYREREVSILMIDFRLCSHKVSKIVSLYMLSLMEGGNSNIFHH